MLVDKLALQKQLNCIITQIDFVLAFEMYRYLVASLSRKDSESKTFSISQKKNKEKYVRGTDKNTDVTLKFPMTYKCSMYRYH